MPGSAAAPAGPGRFQVIAVAEAGQFEPAAGTVTALVELLMQAWTRLVWVEGASACGHTVTVSLPGLVTHKCPPDDTSPAGKADVKSKPSVPPSSSTGLLIVRR